MFLYVFVSTVPDLLTNTYTQWRELDGPIGNVQRYQWMPEDISIRTTLHSIAVRVLHRLPSPNALVVTEDGDCELSYMLHVTLRKLAGTPVLTTREVGSRAGTRYAAVQSKTSAKSWISAIAADDHDAIKSLVAGMTTSDYSRNIRPLNSALDNEARVVGVRTKQLPANTVARIRLELGYSPTEALEARCRDILKKDLPSLLSGRYIMEEEYQRLLHQRVFSDPVALAEYKLDLAAAQSNGPNALLDRLLSQISPLAAQDALEPGLQAR